MNPTETSRNQFDTQAIDRLFLELSQFTNAKTRREIELEEALKRDGRLDSRSDAAWGSTKNRVEHLEKVIASLRAERDDNYKEIKILKSDIEQKLKCCDELKAQRDKMTEEGLAISKERDSLRKELDDLKANNRYQRGHTDGYTEALARIQEQVLKMRV